MIINLMKNNLLISLILIFSSQNNFFGQTDIDQLISKMTVEEKVGQMTQLNLGFLSSKGNLTSKEIDSNKIQTAINNYHVGSILNTAGTAYSVNKWHQIISTIQDFSIKTTHKIPILYGIDAIHGATYTKESTLFPHNIGLAASRNKNLAYEIALVTAKETRASGIRWNFDPVLDVGRNPLWPRFCETFGEDPYLVSQMGVQMINGYQNDALTSITAVSSCMKHFLGYSVPKSGKDRTEAYISDLSLWQKHIPSFKAAIDAGASTIMINSSMINDVPVHSSYELLTELLRNKLGFKGLIVTDWEDIIRLHKRHKIAETPKQAVKIAINAGIDMSMVPNSYSFCEHLVSLVKSGEISENRINESVKRILQLKIELGLFENPYPEKEALDNFGKPEYRMLALKAARESIVLLKNNSNTLPLSKDKKYLVLGPGANCLSALNG
ncbi:MAG: beta-glucosidase, partial [Flavobacteriales bacterium]|nr:beta-glucosidase [Flavobacteriales bacterium]